MGMTSKSRKGFKAFSLAMAAITAAGCATGSAEDRTSATESVTVTWWDYFGYSPGSNLAVDTLINRYQDAHPNVRIQRTAIPFPEFHTKIVEAAGAGKLPDIAVIDTPDVPLLASQGALADLTDRYKGWEKSNQFLEPVLESINHGDRLYGVPLRSNTTALIYNKNVLAAAPTTWQELRSSAKTTTKDGRYGLCFAAGANEALTFNFLPFVWQAGGDVDTIGDAPAVEALTYVNDLFNVDRSVPEAALNWTHSDVEKEFTAGRCAMMINGPWVLPGMAKVQFQWGTAPLPAGAKGVVSPLGGEAWVVGARSPHADVAWDVLTWLAESRNSAHEIGGGLGAIPNRNDTLNDPVWKWGPGVGAYISEMLTTRSRSRYGPKYAKVSEAIWTMTQQVVKKEKRPQAAAAEAQAKITPLLPAG
ncbi:sugar ABC transporter substrate-binding protein [Lentzea sp. NBRC 105346]|nr:sugar ABC transporter substrate-binding protein [Lentzea sp. NBRC 105346]